LYEHKNRSATKITPFLPVGIPKDLGNNYIDIADWEFQHLFDFIFRVLMCGIGVVFYKVIFD
jgi:hypothetical protein